MGASNSTPTHRFSKTTFSWLVMLIYDFLCPKNNIGWCKKLYFLVRFVLLFTGFPKDCNLTTATSFFKFLYLVLSVHLTTDNASITTDKFYIKINYHKFITLSILNKPLCNVWLSAFVSELDVNSLNLYSLRDPCSILIKINVITLHNHKSNSLSSINFY